MLQIVFPQELPLPWARPFHVGGQTYLDGNLLHVWTGTGWVAVGHRGNNTYAADRERVYVIPHSRDDPTEETAVLEAFRGTARLLFTTEDHREVGAGTSLPVSGRKAGPWFPQSDGSALVVRGNDASMATQAQWLHLTSAGEPTVLLEHGRPERDPYRWPIHASASGVIVAGTTTGTLVWDRAGDAPPTQFPMEGPEAVAVDGGAYLRVDDEVHWLDLATGESAEVHEGVGPDTTLEAAAPGHLWLLDWNENRLSHVDLDAKKTHTVAESVHGTALRKGSMNLTWKRVDRTEAGITTSRWTVPLRGGAATEVETTSTHDLLERDGQLVQLTATDVACRSALVSADGVIGHIYGPVPIGTHVLFGDWLVQTNAGILATPIEWGAEPHTWP